MTAAAHLFLSPHLDDAALSCGGTIHRLSAAGERAVVLTVCAGAPPEARLSDYAVGLHERWGQPREAAAHQAAAMVARRREEDLAACAELGAEAIHLAVPDLIYRRRPDGGWAAERDEDLFAGPAAVAEEDVAALASALEQAGGPWRRVHAPLGIGDHVDHHLVRLAAERLAGGAELLLYEDYPYAADEAARRAALEGGDWRPVDSPIGASDLDAKVRAVAAFRSQISSFWAGEAAMEEAVRAFARGKGGAPRERLWRRAAASGRLVYHSAQERHRDRSGAETGGER